LFPSVLFAMIEVPITKALLLLQESFFLFLYVNYSKNIDLKLNSLENGIKNDLNAKVILYELSFKHIFNFKFITTELKYVLNTFTRYFK